MSGNPVSNAAATYVQLDTLRRIWMLPLYSLALNLGGLGIVAAVQIGLRFAGRSSFPFDTESVLLYGLLTLLPSVGSAVAARQGVYGPAALLAAVTIPVSLVAALVALLWTLFSLSHISTVTLLVIASFFLASTLFLVSALMSVIASRADLDMLETYSSSGSGQDDD